VTYPIIADPNRQIIKQLNMVDPDEKDSSGNPLPSRALHMIGPDKTVIFFFGGFFSLTKSFPLLVT